MTRHHDQPVRWGDPLPTPAWRTVLWCVGYLAVWMLVLHVSMERAL